MNIINTLYLIHACQLGDHLVAVPLIDKEPLSLARVTHLQRVLRHESVEECIVFLSDCSYALQQTFFSLLGCNIL